MKSGWLRREGVEKIESEGTNAYRIFSSEGCYVDYLNGVCLIALKDGDVGNELLKMLDKWFQEMGKQAVEAVYQKRLTNETNQRGNPEWVRGRKGIECLEILENGVRYEVDFTAGYSMGLFLDQRANRRRVLKEVKEGDRLLNCFAYTCGFSVCGALAGADTVSVDLSKSSLERGKKNFLMNGIDVSQHAFLAQDVRDILARFGRKGRVFEWVILDPPTFSHGGKRGVFKLQKEFGCLIKEAFGLVGRGGKVLVSTNCDALVLEDVRALCDEQAKKVGCSINVYGCEPLIDFLSGELPSYVWVEKR